MAHSINPEQQESGWVVGKQWPTAGKPPENTLPTDNGAIRTEQRTKGTETVAITSVQNREIVDR